MNRVRLFLHRNPYDVLGTESLFLSTLKENLIWHRDRCTAYAAILAHQKFEVTSFNHALDLGRIPALSTLFIKRHSEQLRTIPAENWAIRATSSGTRGMKSTVGFDRETYAEGIGMMLRFFSWHDVLSARPVHYLVLGYEPSPDFELGAAKTAYGATKFAPARSRTYVLRKTKTGHEINYEGLERVLKRILNGNTPVRFVGFPAYLHFLILALKKRGIRLKDSPHGKVLLGGGWKQFDGETVDRKNLMREAEMILGIRPENFLEFFSAVEHPLPYCKCREGHFHIPIYSRVIARDVFSLEPLPEGQAGLLNFISPLVRSMPLASVVTDDIGVVYHQNRCGCGLNTPYFDWIERAGVQQIKTCATDAAEWAVT